MFPARLRRTPSRDRSARRAARGSRAPSRGRDDRRVQIVRGLVFEDGPPLGRPGRVRSGAPRSPACRSRAGSRRRRRRRHRRASGPRAVSVSDHRTGPRMCATQRSAPGWSTSSTAGAPRGGAQQQLGIIARSCDEQGELGDDRSGDAAEPVHRDAGSGVLRDAVPDRAQRPGGVDRSGHRAHTSSSTPSTSLRFRRTSARSVSSSRSPTARYRSNAFVSSTPSNCGRK